MRIIKGPESFGFKEQVLHLSSDWVPGVDKWLEDRAEWFIKNSGMEKYLKEGGQYLDVGTGKGHITQHVLADMEKSGTPLRGYYGIDVADKPSNKVQKRESKRKNKPLAENKNPMSFVWATAEALPLADKSLDGVSYIFSIHHMDREMTDRVMQEAMRVLKPDGYIFVAEDIVGTDEQRQRTEKRDRQLNWEGKDAEHNYKSDQEWGEYFEDMGLDVVEKNFFESETKKGPIPHGFYVLRLKQESDK